MADSAGGGGVASGISMILIGVWLLAQSIGGNLAGRIRGVTGGGVTAQKSNPFADPDHLQDVIDRKNEVRADAGLPPMSPDEVVNELGKTNPFADPGWTPRPK